MNEPAGSTRIGGYDAAFGAVARQTVAPMLDAAGDRLPGMHVLDVCCGPGMLSAGVLGARRETGRHRCVSVAAVELARTLVPEGSFELGDAQALALPDATFDAVVCGYGLMHLPEPALALREILRVLRPGGRASFSVWDASGVGFKRWCTRRSARAEPWQFRCRTDPIFSSSDRRSLCGRH